MPVTRDHYQHGSLVRVPRAAGKPDVWVFRWREADADGRRVQKKKMIGSVTQLKSLAQAERAVETLRQQINAQNRAIGLMTFGKAWGHYIEHELMSPDADPEIDRSPTTRVNYVIVANAMILPYWKDVPLSEITPHKVKSWLEKLSRKDKDGKSVPYSRGSKAKARGVMSAVFNYCLLNEMAARNPVRDVKQARARKIVPEVMSIDETMSLLREIHNPAMRMAALLSAVTGMRRSETAGLKWEDVDLDGGTIHPKRGLIGSMVSHMKTEASRSSLPIPPLLCAQLRDWRRASAYNHESDWVFASPQSKGKHPFWMDSALRRQIRPAALRAGITKKIGWHTFRRSLSTLLVARNVDIKTAQELLRHADSRTTLNLYAQGNIDNKRAAQEYLTRLLESGRSSGLLSL